MPATGARSFGLNGSRHSVGVRLLEFQLQAGVILPRGGDVTDLEILTKLSEVCVETLIVRSGRLAAEIGALNS